MPFADLEVELIMPRRDLQRAGTEFEVNAGIGDQRNQAVEAAQRQSHMPAQMRLPALVVGMHGNRHVRRNRLRPRGRDRHAIVQFIPPLIDERVAHVPELALFLLVLHLDIRERRQHLRIPVDDPRAAINLAVLEQVDERLPHRVARRRIERERRSLPVAGRPHPPRLRRDPRSRHPDPVPDALLERLASQVVPSHALARELLLHHALRRDPGVVQTGQPERRLAQHPMPAD